MARRSSMASMSSGRNRRTGAGPVQVHKGPEQPLDGGTGRDSLAAASLGRLQAMASWTTAPDQAPGVTPGADT